MVELWYAILVAMLGAYLVLDGWNIGTGVVHYAIGRDQADRRLNMRALGPSWSWHEVWLIGFGGILFMAFPMVYASAFAGFYFAFFLLLWALILRGIAIEVRNLIDDALWRSWWDGIFCCSSTALAFLIGLTAANLLRGVPLDAHGDFSLPLFTHFDVHGAVGLLDWYTLPVGLFSILALGAHGAGYVAVQATGAHQLLAQRVARRWWLTVLAALPVMSVLTGCVHRGYFQALGTHPLACLACLLPASGLFALACGLWLDRVRLVFAGGAVVLFGLVATTGALLFPTMLSSTTAAPAISAVAASIPGSTLAWSLGWWLISAALLAGYLVFVLRHAYAADDQGH
jgi:cytochrome d ubiquinol oxidase subunit II